MAHLEIIFFFFLKTSSHMISRSIYNLRIDTIYMYDIPFDRSFLQLSNGIRHVMPSTDRKLELKAKDIDDTDGSDRLTAGCVLTDLASPPSHRRLCMPMD